MNLVRRHPYFVAIGLGLLMAAASAKLLFGGSVTNTIPWGVLCLLLGMALTSSKLAWRAGATLGFTISYAFLWLDKTGSTSLHDAIILVFLIVLPSLFGALCGATLSRLGYALRHHMGREK